MAAGIRAACVFLFGLVFFIPFVESQSSCEPSFSSLCPNPGGAVETIGSSVSIDGNRVAISGVSSDGSGIVLIYKNDGDAWKEVVSIAPQSISADDDFGFSLSLSGRSVAIGAPGDSLVSLNSSGSSPPNLKQSGSVYIFDARNGEVTAFLKASNAEANDRFGSSVSLSSSTLIVGAPYEDGGVGGLNGWQMDNSSPNSGAAYNFQDNGGQQGWIQRNYFKSESPDPGDRYGTSVLVTSNFYVVGSPFEDSIDPNVNGSTTDNSGENTGTAYVYRNRGGGDASFSVALKSTDSLKPEFNNQLFGWSVAGTSMGDWILIGAPADPFSTLAGTVYVFDRKDTDEWRFRSKRSRSEQGDRYGFSLQAYDRIAITGAPNGNNGTGVVELLKRDDGRYEPEGRQPELSSTGVSAFGYSTGIVEDYAVASTPSGASGAFQIYDVGDLDGRSSSDSESISVGQIFALLIGTALLVIICIGIIVVLVYVLVWPVRLAIVARWNYRKEHDLGRPNIIGRIKMVPDKAKWAIDDFRGLHTFESDAPMEETTFTSSNSLEDEADGGDVESTSTSESS